jgi:hypothetical protein
MSEHQDIVTYTFVTLNKQEQGVTHQVLNADQLNVSIITTDYDFYVCIYFQNTWCILNDTYRN